jgi:hypothetical protein
MAIPVESGKELVTLRVNRATLAEVRSIAADEDESTSAVIRRLLRRGLEHERRAERRAGGEAAS